MAHSARDEILARVRRDMNAAQEAIAEFQRRQKDAEAEYERLRGVEEYLLRLPADSPTVPVEDAAPKSVPAPVTDATVVGLKWTKEEVSEMAKSLLMAKGRGGFVRAIDVAVALEPKYNRKSDRRNFENRVFSILKRLPDVFKRANKGKWTLKESGPRMARLTDDLPDESPEARKP